MPRTKRKLDAPPPPVELPKGFYLNNGFYYVRIYKPHPKTGAWGMWAESTGCKQENKAGALHYKEKREQELGSAHRLGQKIDPGAVRVNELFRDYLDAVRGETRRDCENLIFGAKTSDGLPVRKDSGMLAKHFGSMLAKDVNVLVCRAYRRLRTAHGKKQTTINRELSKLSKSFKLGLILGKVTRMPAGGCDFDKKPETENTRRVRLPEKYYSTFRDALDPALRCLFVIDYNIGRRLSEMLRLTWDRVDFEEECIYFEKTKFGPGKAPFWGEMKKYLIEQRLLRDKHAPGSPHVFFWFAHRRDKNGKIVADIRSGWSKAVEALNEVRAKEGEDAIDLHFHDLRRSAHYLMRKAGIDPQMRRDIMGHKTSSMDDRYAMIDDEDMEQAKVKMQDHQTRQGLLQRHSDELVRLREENARLQRELGARDGSAHSTSP